MSTKTHTTPIRYGTPHRPTPSYDLNQRIVRPDGTSSQIIFKSVLIDNNKQQTTSPLPQYDRYDQYSLNSQGSFANLHKKPTYHSSNEEPKYNSSKVQNDMTRIEEMMDEKNRQLNEWMSKYVQLEQKINQEIEQYKRDMALQMQIKQRQWQDEVNFYRVQMNHEKMIVQEELNSTIQRVQMLEVENRQLTNQLNNQQKFIDKQSNTTDSQHKSQERKPQEDNSMISNLKQDNDVLRQENTALKQLEQTLQTKLTELQVNSANSIKREQNDLHETQQAFDSRKSRDLGTISKLLQDKKDLTSELENKRSQIAHLQNQLDAQTDQMNKMRSQHFNRRDSDDGTQDRLRSMQSDLEQKQRQMHSYYETLKKDYDDELIKAKEELDRVNQRLKETIEKLQNAQQEHQDAIQRLTADFNDREHILSNQISIVKIQNHQLCEEFQRSQSLVDTVYNQVIHPNEDQKE